MRTTLDLPEELYRQVKITAVQQGVTMKTFLERAVVNELKNRSRSDPKHSTERSLIPIVRMKNRTPINLTNAEAEEALFGHLPR